MLLTCKDFDAFKQRKLYVRTAILVLSKHNQYIRLVLGYREVYSATWKPIRGKDNMEEHYKNTWKFYIKDFSLTIDKARFANSEGSLRVYEST